MQGPGVTSLRCFTPRQHGKLHSPSFSVFSEVILGVFSSEKQCECFLTGRLARSCFLSSPIMTAFWEDSSQKPSPAYAPQLLQPGMCVAEAHQLLEGTAQQPSPGAWPSDKHSRDMHGPSVFTRHLKAPHFLIRDVFSPTTHLGKFASMKLERKYLQESNIWRFGGSGEGKVNLHNKKKIVWGQ